MGTPLKCQPQLQYYIKSFLVLEITQMPCARLIDFSFRTIVKYVKYHSGAVVFSKRPLSLYHAKTLNCHAPRSDYLNSCPISRTMCRGVYRYQCNIDTLPSPTHGNIAELFSHSTEWTTSGNNFSISRFLLANYM